MDKTLNASPSIGGRPVKYNDRLYQRHNRVKIMFEALKYWRTIAHRQRNIAKDLLVSRRSSSPGGVLAIRPKRVLT